MKKGLTEIVFILDRSGSMGGLESDTIGGYNALLEKQRAEEGEAILTTVLFDDRVEILHDRMDLREVRNITREEYYVRGCTALLDAVGETVERIHTAQKYARPEDRPEKTVVVITTDGMENASRRYTYAEVKRMVERRREADRWEFLFLGANIDAAAEAERFGIDRRRSARYEHDGVGSMKNCHAMGKGRREARCAATPEAMNAGFDADVLKEVREDCAKRHKD